MNHVPDLLFKQTVKVIFGHFNGAPRQKPEGQMRSNQWWTVYGKPVNLSH